MRPVASYGHPRLAIDRAIDRANLRFALTSTTRPHNSRCVGFNHPPGFGTGNHEVVTAGALGAAQVAAVKVMAFGMVATIGAPNRLNHLHLKNLSYQPFLPVSQETI